MEAFRPTPAGNASGRGCSSLVRVDPKTKSVKKVGNGKGSPYGINVDMFGRIWIADDERFLFVRIELGDEIDLAENNDLQIYLDTDANADTGLPIGGIGAELEWRFGDREGFFRWEGDKRA